jgi:nicotinamide-nucleotide amidase
MKIELIITGEEVLDGRVVDTNSQIIIKALSENGFKVQAVNIVGDAREQLVQTIVDVAKRSDVAIMTGGLGPTDDDHTRYVLAKAKGVGLVRDNEVYKEIEGYFTKRDKPMNPASATQSDIPETAKLIVNRTGLAPGMQICIDGCEFFALSGIPREMKYMLEDGVIKVIKKERQGGKVVVNRIIKCFGVGESTLELSLKDLYGKGVYFGYQIKFPETHVLLRVEAELDEAKKRIGRIEKEIIKKISEYIIGFDSETFAETIVNKLKKLGKKLALAESCTGGLVAKMITDVSGSSAIFDMGIITYANSAKEIFLDVNSVAIEENGAVSEVVASQMAESVKRKAKADIGVGITGIAGPDGGSEEKAVGTVYIACASSYGVYCERFEFMGNREMVRLQAAYRALAILKKTLNTCS